MNLSWLLIFGALGQIPNVPEVKTMSEIRQSLNRFDEFDKISLEAKAKSEAKKLSSKANDLRRTQVQQSIKTFALLELDISPPWKDAEYSMIEDLADSASKPYDFITKPDLPLKGWYNTSQGQVWGWVEPKTGYIHYYQQEQPVAPVTSSMYFSCKNGRCPK